MPSAGYWENAASCLLLSSTTNPFQCRPVPVQFPADEALILYFTYLQICATCTNNNLPQKLKITIDVQLGEVVC